MAPRSAQCEDPAVDNQHERCAAKCPLNTGSWWMGHGEGDEDPQHTASQKTEEVRPEVDTLSPGSQHREEGKTGGNGYPGSAPAHSPEAASHDAKAAQHADGTENGGGGPYGDME